jgi:excisionase family DNA binding protein
LTPRASKRASRRSPDGFEAVGCQRYERETGRKVLTWTPPPTSLQKKSTYQGLRLEGDRLYADPIDMALTVAEVAEELNISESDVRKLVADQHLRARLEGDGGQPTFSRTQLYGFQSQIHFLGIQLLKAMSADNLPQTEDAFAEAARNILKTSREESLKEARAKLGKLKRQHT